MRAPAVALLLAATAFAQADDVLEAFHAKNTDKLKALAARYDPDPWIVADELCARGEFDAAAAFV